MWRRWDTPQNFLLAFIDELSKTWKIRILKKWKHIAGDVIILHLCTKNHNHMRYSSWDTEWKNFVWSFWAFCCPLSQPPIPPNNPENQNFEKKNEQSIWRCHHLNLRNKKHNQINDVWLFRYGVWQTCFVILGHFLLFYPTTPLTI